MIVKLYINTGFNSVDIPDSIKMLEDNFTPYREYNNVNLIQNLYTAYVDLPISLGEISQVDYCTLEDTNTKTKRCYIVQSFESTAPDTFRLHLLLDAYNSMGSLRSDSGNVFLSATVKRLSIKIDDDNKNLYTLPEPFSPSQRCDDKIEILHTYDGNYRFIETTTAPPKRKERISTVEPSGSNQDTNYEGSSVGQETGSADGEKYYTVLVVPKIRKINGTTITVMIPLVISGSIETGTQWWNAGNFDDDNFKTLLQDFRLTGRESDIINYWEVPKLFVSNLDNNHPYNPLGDNAGGIYTIWNVEKSKNIEVTGHRFYNKKGNYFQSKTITVFGIASGESISKQLYEVVPSSYKPTDNSVNVPTRTIADIRPNGTPIFMFVCHNGANIEDKFVEKIKGAPWRNITLALEGRDANNTNQQFMNLMHQRRAQQEADYTTIEQAVQGGINVLSRGAQGDLGGAVNAGGQTVMGMLRTEHDYRMRIRALSDERTVLQRQAAMASTTIQIGNSDLVRDINRNTFAYIITEYSERDCVNFDTFLTRFGYNVGNMEITADDLFTRPGFNFVQLEDATIIAGSGNLTLTELCKQQLKEGVRLWHRKPNPADLSAGGNR